MCKRGVRIESYYVYCHTNKINNKKYIGITRQIPKRRWDSGHGYKNNRYFCSAIKKNGWNNFNHEILFEGLSQEDAKRKEIELIASLNTTDREIGYNITKGGESTNGYIPSAEARRKISESNKGRIVSKETREKISKAHLGRIGKRGIENHNYGRIASKEARINMSLAQSGKNHRLYGKHQSDETKKRISDAESIPSIQLDIYGNFIKRWNSLCEANSFGFSDSKISSCCRGNRLSHGGYLWMYESDYILLSKDDVFDKCNILRESIEKYSPKKVLQISLDGNIIKEWDSISKTTKYGFNKGCVSNCCIGRAKTHKGYKWIYLKDYKDVVDIL